MVDASRAAYLSQQQVEMWEKASELGLRDEEGNLERPDWMTQDDFDTLSERDDAMLNIANSGYRVRSRDDADGCEDGFAFATLVDANREDDTDLDPILAFRGTEDWDDVSSDLGPIGVGRNQFESERNQEILRNALAEDGIGARDRLHVTGHSLGGALAERFTARHADDMNIAETVTINGAGVDQGVVNEYNRRQNRVPIYRHIVSDSFGLEDGTPHCGAHLPSWVQDHRRRQGFQLNTLGTHGVGGENPISPNYRHERPEWRATDSNRNNVIRHGRDVLAGTPLGNRARHRSMLPWSRSRP